MMSRAVPGTRLIVGRSAWQAGPSLASLAGRAEYLSLRSRVRALPGLWVLPSLTVFGGRSHVCASVQVPATGAAADRWPGPGH
jgi:hypothetical protein